MKPDEACRPSVLTRSTCLTVRACAQHDRPAVTALSVCAEQTNFVASNDVSLAEAAEEVGAYPFCVVTGDEIVGFLLAVDMAELEPPSSLFDREDAYLWRFMIAAEKQRLGYRRQTMMWFSEWARARGKARLTLTVGQENQHGRWFYERLGYRRTGRRRNGEIECAQTL